MFSEKSDSVIHSIIFVDKILFLTVDGPTNSTIFIDDITGIVEYLIEFVRYLHISFYDSFRFNKKFIKSFTMFKFEMDFLGEFAYYCYIGFLRSWEQESLGVFIMNFKLVNLRWHLSIGAGDNRCQARPNSLPIDFDIRMRIFPQITTSIINPSK